MEVGYFTMPMHPPGSDLTKTLEDDLQQIVTLDKLGYREAWIGEHFTTAWENIPAPDLFIAQALPLTQNIILGTGVTCMPNHNPFVVAHRSRSSTTWRVAAFTGASAPAASRRLRGLRLRSRYGRPSDNDAGSHRPRAADMGRPQAGPVRVQVLELHHSGAPGRHRPALPHQAVPAAAPAHRRGRCVREVGHTDARGRARLAAHEHQPGASAHPEDPLERGGRRRREHGAHRGPLHVAHRARGLRGRDVQGGAPRRHRRRPRPRLHPVLSAGCSPRSAAWAG